MSTKTLHIAPTKMDTLYPPKVYSAKQNESQMPRASGATFVSRLGRLRFISDFPERFERKVSQYNASQNTFKRWLFGNLSVITSTVCMGKNY
jgi:hypothetical protein